VCTVVVVADPSGGYWMAGNRDEARWRSAAKPPHVFEHGAIYPVDPDGGGTWTAANQWGLCFSLLNNYQAPTGLARDVVSRGHIITRLVEHNSIASAAQSIDQWTLTQFEPFVLLIAEPLALKGVRTYRLTWDATTRKIDYNEGSLMQTSAAMASEQAHRWRNQKWRESPLSGTREHFDGDINIDTSLDEFFGAHHPQRSLISVCKHGLIASTVSHTRIRVSADQVSVHYQASAPCKQVEAVQLALARQPS